MKSIKAVAFAPATVANVAVGFDILGFAVDGVGDRVIVQKVKAESSRPPIRILEITGVERNFPTDPERNTATVGLLQLLKDRRLDFHLDVTIEKGIPTQSGMGGSAASAVAGLVAVNSFLTEPLDQYGLLRYSLIGEKIASGDSHPDNAAPCVFGGLTLVQNAEPLRVVSIPTPQEIQCVLVHPQLALSTKVSRSILTPEIPLRDFVKQSANLAGLIAGCFSRNLELIAESLKDVLIEPQRQSLIPGFKAVKAAALASGALGCSISGSGPSVFAWVTERQVKAVSEGMVQAFLAAGIESDFWISSLSPAGARLE